MENNICIFKTKSDYPSSEGNYRPDTHYPEYPFSEISSTENTVYKAVRESFVLLGMDKEHIGLPEWNPLGELITPGNNVLIKPNLVMDINKNPGQGTECLYTQPSVVAAVIDYVIIALKGTGKIIVGDAPMQECNFENIKDNGGYNKLIEFYKEKGIELELVDFRELTSVVKNGVHIATINKNSKGTIIDLEHESEFFGTDQKTMQRTRITNYDPRILNMHHTSEKNEYYISDYVLSADVIINMPKPKSHRKAGATIALKNLVGANVRKEYLPHHTMGSIKEGGDEYLHRSIFHTLRSKLYDQKNICEAEKKYTKARIIRIGIKACTFIMKLTGKDRYHEGSWYGNETISKTISDINKIVFYADKKGKMCDIKQRRMFIVADMIISGEKEGPVLPTAKPVGIIACGYNPVAFDRTIATVMGFLPEKIPTIRTAEKTKGKYMLASYESIHIVSNKKEYNNLSPDKIKKEDILHFEPSAGWKGHLEVGSVSYT